MSAFLAALLVVGLILISATSFGTVQASDVTGIISTDTTWTKANSPYSLTGPVKVNNDVTLTVETGVTVNLNSYYIQVDGTLQAKGSNADQIHFNAGSIKFTDNSNGWNEQTGSGCTIENAILDSVAISSENAIKLSQDTINGDIKVSGASIVSSNTIVGEVTTGDSTVVWKNTITGGIVTNTFAGGIVTGGTPVEYPIISSNTISGGSGFYRWGIESSGYALIIDNTISDCNCGVYLFTAEQQFGGSIAPNAIVERNMITDSTQGIRIEIYPAMVYGSITPSVSSNIISKNTIGVYLDGDARYLTIRNNNIQDNSNHSIYLSSGQNLNATYNWWGTTDTQGINQTIYDFKNDFNLGKVQFIPFLTEPNPQAMPNPNAPIPTPNTSPSPSPSSSPSPTPIPNQESQQTELLEIILAVALIVTLIGVGLLVYFNKRKR